jgi:hypothetical protein
VTELLARVGDLVDEVARSALAVPRSLRAALGPRRRRVTALAIVVVYLAIYLFALGDLDVSTSGRFDRFAEIPSAQVLPDWEGKLFAERAPFLYEPVAVVYVLPQLAFLVSVGNIVVGLGLGLLLTMSVVLALHAGTQVESCRRRNVYTSALGVLPTFLMGFACCAPTFLLALGANVAAALVPVFIPIRSFLLPIAVGLMSLMLLWSSARLRRAERALAELRAEGEASEPPPDVGSERGQRRSRKAASASRL